MKIRNVTIDGLSMRIFFYRGTGVKTTCRGLLLSTTDDKCSSNAGKGLNWLGAMSVICIGTKNLQQRIPGEIVVYY